MTERKHIELSHDGPVTTLTITRPDSLNALNAEVLTEIKGAVEETAGTSGGSVRDCHSSSTSSVSSRSSRRSMVAVRSASVRFRPMSTGRRSAGAMSGYIRRAGR